PGGPGWSPDELRDAVHPDLGHVEIALRVAVDSVRADLDRLAPGQDFSAGRIHRDARNLVRDVERAARVTVDVHRVVKVAPLAVEVALGAEDLHAVVLSVGDEDPIVRVDPHSVRGRELTASGAGRAPREQMLAFGIEPVHGGVAIAIGDVDVAVSP